MKLFYVGKDGGPESTVWGFWPIEIKKLFSVALLCFENGSREAFHTHAFNSISWVLTGRLIEHVKDGSTDQLIEYFLDYSPSWKPVFTKRNRLHKVSSEGRSWVLTFRGPWGKHWWEYWPKQGKFVLFSNGRRIEEIQKCRS